MDKTCITYRIKVLSLKDKVERQNNIKKVLKEYPFTFFWGINGKEYKLTEYDKKWIRGNRYKEWGIHIPSLIAANRSHLLLLEDCIKENIPYIIFEDDTKLIKPLDFNFEDIVKRELDVFWLMPDKPSILAYIVWPLGARKLIDAVDREEGLIMGLDYMWHYLKGTDYLIEDQLWDDYFWQTAGDIDSSITSTLHYGFNEKRLY